MALQMPPIIKDSTGQDIKTVIQTGAANLVTALNALTNAVKPTASDIPLDPITGMSADDVQEGISELKSSLDSLIGTGRIATTSPVTITPTLSGDVHIIVFGRKALSECCVYMYDFWSTDFTLLAGSANHITLTKSAQSNSITVTSNTTNSIP